VNAAEGLTGWANPGIVAQDTTSEIEMYWFAIASLTPAFLLLMACLFGGLWAWAALAFVTALVAFLDRVSKRTLPLREDGKAERFARTLGIVLALVHFVLLAAGVRAIATSPALSGAEALALLVALGLFMGQVSNSNAHELIHATDRPLRTLGVWVYISLLFGHHASAHPKVHHVHVATARDPNSARSGQGFYAFWPRAWVGSFRAGLRAENAARLRLKPPPNPLTHPYVGYVGGAVLFLGLAWRLAGWAGVAAYLGLACYAQMQLILADYVQHYGLRRRIGADGRPEKAGAQHSWNAPQWFSSAMMLNAPRHSDHHMHPMRLFTALRLDRKTMPVLPFSLPMMAGIALLPPLWRRVMDPRVARWQNTHAAGGAQTGDLALSGHAHILVDSPDFDGPAGEGRNAPDGRGF